MNNSAMVLTRADLTAAISKVEKIHNYKLDTISQFIEDNEANVLSGFASMTEMETIEQKFSQMEVIFSEHPEFETNAPFLVEVAALVS